jgi:hypothetical protein
MRLEKAINMIAPKLISKNSLSGFIQSGFPESAAGTHSWDIRG